MDDAVGKLTLPAGTKIITDPSKLGSNLFTPIVYVIIVVAGLWAFLQFLLGGMGYITASGDPKKVQESQNKIIHSIIGLAIMAASFVLAALVGQIFFDDPMFILNPSLKGQ